MPLPGPPYVTRQGRVSYPHTADVAIHESRAESVDEGRIDTAFLSSGLLIRDRREVGRAGVMPSEVASALTAWMLQISA